jgi:hypothetical protein
MSDAAATDLAPADAEADKTGVGDQPSIKAESMVRDVNPDMPAGEHIEKPLPIDGVPNYFQRIVQIFHSK